VVFITKKKEKRRTTVGYTYCSKQNEIKILKEWENNGHVMVKAVLSVFPHYQYNSAVALGNVIIKKNRERIKEYQESEEEMYQQQISNIQERRLWLDSIRKNEDLNVSDRINALKELNRMDGIGKENNVFNVTNVENLSIEDKTTAFLENAERMLLESHKNDNVIETEVVENE
jgi:hypothetical protein